MNGTYLLSTLQDNLMQKAKRTVVHRSFAAVANSGCGNKSPGDVANGYDTDDDKPLIELVPGYDPDDDKSLSELVPGYEPREAYPRRLKLSKNMWHVGGIHFRCISLGCLACINGTHQQDSGYDSDDDKPLSDLVDPDDYKPLSELVRKEAYIYPCVWLVTVEKCNC
jgi:hypothetical protein